MSESVEQHGQMKLERWTIWDSGVGGREYSVWDMYSRAKHWTYIGHSGGCTWLGLGMKVGAKTESLWYSSQEDGTQGPVSKEVVCTNWNQYILVMVAMQSEQILFKPNNCIFTPTEHATVCLRIKKRVGQ